MIIFCSKTPKVIYRHLTRRSWWENFIRPAPVLTADVDKDRSRLLASITLGSLVLHTLALVAMLFNPELRVGFWLAGLSLMVHGVIYGLSRTRHYHWGIWLSVGLTLAWTFGVLTVEPQDHFAIVALLPVFIISLFYQTQVVLLGGGLLLVIVIIFLNFQARETNHDPYILLLTAMTMMLTVITALRQYNRELRDERTRSLAQSELRFRTIFEASMSGFYLLECIRNAHNEIEDFLFLDANQKGLELVNMKREQLIGQRLLRVSPRPDKDAFFEKYRHVVETGEGYAEDFPVEKPTGVTDWFTHQVVKINDGIAISTIDISSHKQKESAALQALLEKERTDMLRNFVGEFSHDLLTPITILRTSLYLLSKDTDPVIQTARIQKLNNHLTKLEKMIRDLLTLSQLDGPLTQEFTLEPHNLNHLLDTLIEDYQQVAAQRQQHIAFEPAADLPLVPLDVHTISRALGNLIDNALKYTPEGGAVFVHTQKVDNRAVVSIRDTGPGIEPENLALIFERFYREERHRKLVSGTGLGLAIVQKIIQGHDGSIDESSTVGEGTTFQVTLPVISNS